MSPSLPADLCRSVERRFRCRRLKKKRGSFDIGLSKLAHQTFYIELNARRGGRGRPRQWVKGGRCPQKRSCTDFDVKRRTVSQK